MKAPSLHWTVEFGDGSTEEVFIANDDYQSEDHVYEVVAAATGRDDVDDVWPNGLVGATPTPTSQPTLEDQIDSYLRGLGCTIWGQNFNIIHPDGRKEAVAWFAKHVRGLAEHAP